MHYRSLTWAHGVNSQEHLRTALASGVDMLEADLMYSSADPTVCPVYRVIEVYQ